MSRYRKKPVVIEAFKWTGDFDALNAWLDGLGYEEGSGDDSQAMWENEIGQLVIPTLEGDMTASFGDFIIRGVQGEFYPCKPDIFAETYEPVADGGVSA